MSSATALRQLLSKAHDRPLVGTSLISGSPDWMHLCANAGMDFVCVDQMVTSIGWTETANMLRGARAGGASAWIRIPAYPWGEGDQRAAIQRNALRAVSAGAELVTASVDSVEEAQALLDVQHDEHRSIAVGGLSPQSRGAANPPSMVPLVESIAILDDLDELVRLPELEAIFLGVGDLSRLNDLDPDVEEPGVQQLISEVVATCRANDVVVMSSAGVARSGPTMLRATRVLWELGVEVVWLTYPNVIVHDTYRHVIDGLVAKES